jgi:hypothetical protein
MEGFPRIRLAKAKASGPVMGHQRAGVHACKWGIDGSRAQPKSGMRKAFPAELVEADLSHPEQIRRCTRITIFPITKK